MITEILVRIVSEVYHIPYPLLRMYHRGSTFPLAIIFFTVQGQDILASSAITISIANITAIETDKPRTIPRCPCEFLPLVRR